MLYGAYGSTGRLILDEALRRGHRPRLAGRDGYRLAELGRETGLAVEPLALEDGAALRRALSRVRAVVNAAGPFRLTGPAMRAACLDAGCSYFDVNGELEDFNAALACDAEARARDIAIVPGVGYGVVFGESLAGEVASRLPDATWLRLSLATQTAGRSRGASLSQAAAIAGGGREIREHRLQERALAFSSWRAPDSSASKMRFSAAPLAELVAAHRFTGIANIVAGIALPRAAATLETGEGYRAAAAAVRAIELQLREPRRGALTPAQAFGTRFALLVPGTQIRELSVGVIA